MSDETNPQAQEPRQEPAPAGQPSADRAGKKQPVARNEKQAMDLGVYGRKAEEAGLKITATEIIALSLTVLWLLAAALFYMLLGRGSEGAPAVGLRFVMVLLSIVLPVALIWVAAAAARSARVMREESEKLHSAITGMRQSYLQMQQSVATGTNKSVEKKLEEIAIAQRKTEDAIATFTSIRPAARTPETKAAIAVMPSADEQGLLALGTPAEALNPPLSVNDFIRALNFPETAEDKDGFRALRLALADRKVSQLVQSSQDVLTLLSQDGIYMDDLRPDRARPEVWRKFAAGERGGAVAPLGGVRDRSSLALAAGRMRQDGIFRDAVHHFLRKFDHTLAEFEKTASDQELAELSDTRTARAFMLLGRVAGTFD